MDLPSPELPWARSHLAASPEQLWSWSSPRAGGSENPWEGAGEGRGAVLVPGFDLQSRHSQISHPSSKAEMSSCDEGEPLGNAAMLTQLPQHIHMPPLMSFIVPNSHFKVLGRHMPLLLLLPLFLHRAAAGKKGEKDLGKT